VCATSAADVPDLPGAHLTCDQTLRTIVDKMIFAAFAFSAAWYTAAELQKMI
jgi:hypothetical protein